MTDQPSDNPILYYDLRPVYSSGERKGQILSACCVQCIATGRILGGAGGPGYALAPEIVNALDMQRAGDGPKAIVDGNDLDRAAALLGSYGNHLRSQHELLLANGYADRNKEDPLGRTIKQIDDLVTKFRREES